MQPEPAAKQASKTTAQSTGAGSQVSAPGKPGQPGGSGAPGGAVSDELVRKVADIVYARLLAELRLDFERQRISGSRIRSRTALVR
jgi:hypothetical protein